MRNKIEFIEMMTERLEIDILITQEWGGWQGEEEWERNKISGFTNFMSFKKKKKPIKEKKSVLVMNKKERINHRKRREEGRKRGTTILVRNELVRLCNISEAIITKDGEIEIVELSIKGKKMTIIGIHGEPESDKQKKESFFKKVRNVVENNVTKDSKIIMGGDANSVWDDEDTTNENKDDLDKTIKSFCEEMGWVDISREWNIKNKIEKGEEWNRYTWGKEKGEKTAKVEKRLDSFWGKPEWSERVTNTVTIQKRWIPSDHLTHIIDLEMDEEWQVEMEEEGQKIEANNKNRGEKMDKEEWKEYKNLVEEKLKKDKLIQDQEEKLNKREGLNELEIEEGIERIEEILNSTLKKVFEERTERRITRKDKKDEEKKEEERKKGNEKDKEGNFLAKINIKAFSKEKRVKEDEETEKRKEREKLPKGIDGPTAKLIRIRLKLWFFREKIKRVMQGRTRWGEEEKERTGRMGDFLEELRIKDYEDKEELERVAKEAKKAENKLSRIIYRRKDRYRRIEIKNYIKELEQEGWKGTKKFYDRILKKGKKRKSIRKIPEKYLKPGRKETDPEDIKKMIREFWEKLYTSKGKGVEEEEEGEEKREWFKGEEWKRYKKKNEENKRLEELTHIISREEIGRTIQGLKNGKAPGPDEIVNEQIKYGPEILWEILRRRYNEIIKNKKIPQKWKEINIFMIHKKEDTNDPDKYRGITLSSVVYKIMTKILAKRLLERVTEGKMIDEAQGVGKMGEASYNEARTLHNIIEDANQYEQRVDIGYIDLTKAYDMVETWALEEVLRKMEIPEGFREIIMDINTGTKVSVITDYGKTEQFIATRGVRQGCPLSPLLFCLFLEPLIKWIKEGKEGYRFKNNKEIKIAILAYMDDIALVARDREEMKNMLGKIEKFCNLYGMEISDKSVYTSNKDGEEEKEELKAQEINLKEIKKEEAYKYLGFWTTADGNWRKHKKEAKIKHQATINLLSGGRVDARVKTKLINIVANTPLEYGFHSVPYTEEEINELNGENKKLAKRMFRVSIQCPTTLLKMDPKEGGMGVRDLWEIYKEINIGDLGDVLNFHDKQSLYYRTTKQRIEDIEKTNKINMERKNKIVKDNYNKYWVVRAIRLAQKEGITIVKNKKEIEYTRETTINELKEVMKDRVTNEKEWGELENLGLKINEIFEDKHLKGWEEINKKREGKKLKKKEWEKIKKLLCREGKTRVRRGIWEEITKNKRKTDFEKDVERGQWVMEDNFVQRERERVFSDGSAKEDKAAFGCWRKKGQRRKVAYRVWGTQNAYNGEIKGAIYSVNSTPPNTERDILIDNSAVINIAKKIKNKDFIKWNKQAEPELVRMLKDRIEWKETVENVGLNFIKVKGHAGVRGNEKADELAKKGLEGEETYIGKGDMYKYQNEVSIWKGGREIKGRYRQELKEIHKEENRTKAKEDKNEQWRRMMNVEANIGISNNVMKNKEIAKGVTIMIIKGRTDLLPHAAQLVERKIENIKTTSCSWCGVREDTEHILLDCKRYKKEREEIWERVVDIIWKSNPRMNNKDMLRESIPKWFLKEEREEVVCLFPKLRDFDKMAGILGYIPKDLTQVIKQFSYEEKKKRKREDKKKEEKMRNKRIKEKLVKIHREIVEGAHRIWLKQNQEWDKWANEEEEGVRGQIDRIIPIREEERGKEEVRFEKVFEKEGSRVIEREIIDYIKEKQKEEEGEKIEEEESAEEEERQKGLEEQEERRDKESQERETHHWEEEGKDIEEEREGKQRVGEEEVKKGRKNGKRKGKKKKEIKKKEKKKEAKEKTKEKGKIKRTGMEDKEKEKQSMKKRKREGEEGKEGNKNRNEGKKRKKGEEEKEEKRRKEERRQREGRNNEKGEEVKKGEKRKGEEEKDEGRKDVRQKRCKRIDYSNFHKTGEKKSKEDIKKDKKEERRRRDKRKKDNEEEEGREREKESDVTAEEREKEDISEEPGKRRRRKRQRKEEEESVK